MLSKSQEAEGHRATRWLALAKSQVHSRMQPHRPGHKVTHMRDMLYCCAYMLMHCQCSLWI